MRSVALTATLLWMSCAGCAPKTSIHGKALVVGYLDLEHGSPAHLSWATLKQISPETSAPFRPMSVGSRGLVFRAVPVGTYQLTEFGGQGKSFVPCVGINQGQVYAYGIPDDSKVGRIDASEPDIRFFGAFRFVPADATRSTLTRKTNDFALAPLEFPGEREVLVALLKHVKRRGVARLIRGPDPWEAVIERRLASVLRAERTTSEPPGCQARSGS